MTTAQSTELGQVWQYRPRSNVSGQHNLLFESKSPDGETLFVNIQTPGLTFAIWGPWEDGAL